MTTQPEHPPCACCGVIASEEHHGLWWCQICLWRGHHEDEQHVEELRQRKAAS